MGVRSTFESTLPWWLSMFIFCIHQGWNYSLSVCDFFLHCTKDFPLCYAAAVLKSSSLFTVIAAWEIHAAPCANWKIVFLLYYTLNVLHWCFTESYHYDTNSSVRKPLLDCCHIGPKKQHRKIGQIVIWNETETYRRAWSSDHTLEATGSWWSLETWGSHRDTVRRQVQAFKRSTKMFCSSLRNVFFLLFAFSFSFWRL